MFMYPHDGSCVQTFECFYNLFIGILIKITPRMKIQIKEAIPYQEYLRTLVEHTVNKTFQNGLVYNIFLYDKADSTGLKFSIAYIEVQSQRVDECVSCLRFVESIPVLIEALQVKTRLGKHQLTIDASLVSNDIFKISADKMSMEDSHDLFVMKRSQKMESISIFRSGLIISPHSLCFRFLVTPADVTNVVGKVATLRRTRQLVHLDTDERGNTFVCIEDMALDGIKHETTTIKMAVLDRWKTVLIVGGVAVVPVALVAISLIRRYMHAARVACCSVEPPN